MEQHRAYLRDQARFRLARAGRADLDASDFAQDALALALARKDQFRGRTEAEMRPWLLRILANRIIDETRRLACRERRFGRPRPLDTPGIGLESREPDPGVRLNTRERDDDLYRMLAALPEDQRAALRLRYFEGLSVDEAAGRMGRTPAAVAGLVRRGLSTLRLRMTSPP